MAIAKLKPTEMGNFRPQIPSIQPPTYKSVVIDERTLPKEQLLAYISGSNWTIEYYQQVLGEDNELKEFDIAQGATVQQYNLIHKLELKVEGELSNSSDSEKALTTITGNGSLYPSIIPNVGDVFVAECGRGRVGMFSVTNVERKTFNRDSVYSLEYTCIAFLDEEPAKFHNLSTKVIREFTFNKDRLVSGGVPIITKEEDSKFVKLTDYYHQLVRYYTKNFYEDDIKTIAIPGQSAYAYDYYVASFISKLIGVDEFNAHSKVILYNIEKDRHLRQDQLYSVLIERDYDALFRCNKFMALTTTSTFSLDSTIQSLRYSKIDLIVYPKLSDTTLTKDISRLNARYEFNDIRSGNSDTKALLKSDDLVTDTCTIKSINIDDYYVFSENFYTDTPNQSILETLTLDYLKCNAIEIDKLTLLCDEYRSWGRLEQFYYIPILILLIKSTRNNLY